MFKKILNSIKQGFKTAAKNFGEPGIIQQARVGRAMGILKESRDKVQAERIKKEKAKNRLMNC